MNSVIFFKKMSHLPVLNLYALSLRIKAIFFFLVIICRVGEWVEMSTFISIRELLLVFHLHIAPHSSYIQKEFCMIWGYVFVSIIIPTILQWGRQHDHLHCLNTVTDK